MPGRLGNDSYFGHAPRNNGGDHFMTKVNVGAWVGNILTVLSLNWGLTVSAVIGFLVGIWEWGTSIALNPSVQAGVMTFIAVLWTCIGIKVIKDQNKTKVVKIEQEYAYSIIIDGYQVYYDEDNDESALQIGIAFRNVGVGPIKAKAYMMSIILGDRTIPELPELPTLVMPRLSQKGVRSAPFKKEAVKMKSDGVLTFQLLYGPHDGVFSRIYKIKTQIHLRLDEGKFAFTDTLVSESDEPYIASM